MRTAVVVLALACTPLVGAASASAESRFVSPTGTSVALCTNDDPCALQRAIDIAQAGDEVILAPGTYPRTTRISVYRFTLRGTDPANRPVIDFGGSTLGGNQASVSLEGDSSATRPKLQDLIVKGIATPKGVYVDIGGDLSNVTVTGSASESMCALISNANGTPALVENVTCSNTHTSGRAADLAALPTWGPLNVRNSTFVTTLHAEAAQLRGGGTGSAQITVTNSTFLSPGGPSTVSCLGQPTAALSHDYLPSTSCPPLQLVDDGTSITGTLFPALAADGTLPQVAGDETVDAGSPTGAAPRGIDERGDLRAYDSAPDIGADELTVPPLAAAVAPTGVGETVATLTGAVKTGGAPTTYHFDYGPTAAYGQRSPDITLAGANGDTAVSLPVADLSASTGYHYRLVASSHNGVDTSDDQAFTTAATPLPPPPGDSPVPPVLPGPPAGPQAPPPTIKKTTIAKVTVTKTTLSFRVDKRDQIRVRIERETKGRRKGKRCSMTARTGKRCVKRTTILTKTVAADGTEKITLPKAARRKGTYRLTLTPTSGKTVTKTFTVR